MDETLRLPLRAASHPKSLALRADRLFLLLGFLALCGGGFLPAPARADADACCCAVRPQDQLWLVSDRSLGCNIGCGAPRLQYWRYDCQRRWTRSSLEEMLAAEDPQLATTVFLHGNRIPADEAFTKGWAAYRALIRCADERPVRFVIWSWPSSPIRGPVQDARVKAARTNITGYYLAWFLDQLDPQAPLGIWAHSFGARAVTGALHLLGGGVLCGRVLDEPVHTEHATAQVVFFAAAVDNHWLLPGHTHGQAMSQISQLLLVNNQCDALLKRYHILYGRRSCAEALGYTGLNTWLLGDEADKVMQIEASCQVGRKHLFALYLGASGIMAQTRDVLLSDSWKNDDAPQEVLAIAEPELVEAGNSERSITEASPVSAN